MKKHLLIVGLLLMLITIGLSGCIQQSNTSNKGSIQNLLAKAKNIGPIYYETSVTYSSNASYSYLLNNSSYMMKIWQKLPYMKMITTTISTGWTETMIQRPEGLYQYNLADNKYEMVANTTTQKALEDQVKELSQQMSLKELGTEIIDGKLATIIEYSIGNESYKLTAKYWIWNENGIPLKYVSTTDMGTTDTIMTMEYKNFSFGDIPDSTFDLSVPEQTNGNNSTEMNKFVGYWWDDPINTTGEYFYFLSNGTCDAIVIDGTYQVRDGQLIISDQYYDRIFRYEFSDNDTKLILTGLNYARSFVMYKVT